MAEVNWIVRDARLADLPGYVPAIARTAPESLEVHGSREKPVEMYCRAAGGAMVDEPRTLIELDVYASNLIEVNGATLHPGRNIVACFTVDLPALESMVLTEESWRDYEQAHRAWCELAVERIDALNKRHGKAKAGVWATLDHGASLALESMGVSPQSIMAERRVRSWEGKKFRSLVVLGDYARPAIRARHERENRENLSETLAALRESNAAMVELLRAASIAAPQAAAKR